MKIGRVVPEICSRRETHTTHIHARVAAILRSPLLQRRISNGVTKSSPIRVVISPQLRASTTGGQQECAGRSPPGSRPPTDTCLDCSSRSHVEAVTTPSAAHAPAVLASLGFSAPCGTSDEVPSPEYIWGYTRDDNGSHFLTRDPRLTSHDSRLLQFPVRTTKWKCSQNQTSSLPQNSLFLESC